MKNKVITIGGQTVPPGSRRVIDLPVADLYTHTSLNMPVQVINGRTAGPTLFVCAAVHGDEINGVEIIRRLLKFKVLSRIRGALIAVPIVNVHGFLDQSRYLPDRRDLNRSFPGSERGSVAARLAHLLVTEIIDQIDCGVDLHTGAIHRCNLPQIRANLGDSKTGELARLFGVPVLIDSTARDGSLRQYAAEQGIPMLVYEAGEALRFDDLAIRAGTRGLMNLMRELRMLPGKKGTAAAFEPIVARQSSWARAPVSGVVRSRLGLGHTVNKGDQLAIVSDPFGEVETSLIARFNGVVIGRSNLPLALEGDALFNIARFDDVEDAGDTVEDFRIAHGQPSFEI
jgi:hypothetical protein